MSRRRYDNRDANEGPLVEMARRFGAELVFIGEPADWLMAWRGRWIVVEIKNPDGKNRYTRQQMDLMAMAGRKGAPLWTWREEADVLRDMGARQTAGVA